MDFFGRQPNNRDGWILPNYNENKNGQGYPGTKIETENDNDQFSKGKRKSRRDSAGKKK